MGTVKPQSAPRLFRNGSCESTTADINHNCRLPTYMHLFDNETRSRLDAHLPSVSPISSEASDSRTRVPAANFDTHPQNTYRAAEDTPPTLSSKPYHEFDTARRPASTVSLRATHLDPECANRTGARQNPRPRPHYVSVSHAHLLNNLDPAGPFSPPASQRLTCPPPDDATTYLNGAKEPITYLHEDDSTTYADIDPIGRIDDWLLARRPSLDSKAA
ncbi:hypothetical protein BD413DRAFT_494972 [Trametes elegans]|nr:hypothetical protein BD413DRAFT_494972 [Trametes elegans]